MSAKHNILGLISGLQVDVQAADFTHVWPGWDYKEHRPNYNRLYYIVSGYGYVTVDGVRYEPKAQNLVLIPAKSLVSFGTLDGWERYTKYWVHFEARAGNSSLFDLVPAPIVTHVDEPERFQAAFQKILRYYQGETVEDRLFCQAAMLEMIAMYLGAAPKEEGTEPSSSRMQVVLDYIEQHLNRNLTNQELSALIQLHPNYFVKYFRSHVGLSPAHYINRRRVERAKDLLIDRTLNITEVSDALGFSDASYFAHVFKHYTDRTPGQYRREMLQKQDDF